jgi:hypothetical protein
MNPQIQSMLTSLGMLAATSIATMAVTKGIIPGSDQASFANDLVSLVGYGLTALLAWWKTRQVSQPAMVKSLSQTGDGQTAMIKSINNTNNGVTVVATADAKVASIPAVSAPLK